MKIIDHLKRGNRNARQTMLQQKQAHGAGCMPSFPTEQQIAEAMEGYPEDSKIQVYGDGSLTTPTVWWAALGGYGAWIPDWNIGGQEEPHRYEQDLCGPTLGQTGTSTRHELMAWIAVLAKPIRTMFATDSAAMLIRAKQLIQKAEQREEARSKGKPVKSGCPFKKPWRLQTDGDLWEVAWQAIHTRGLANQDLRKVKGHATEEDVQQGRSTACDKEGNDRSDKNADRGVEQLAGEGLVTVGRWVANRQDQYKKFVARIHRMIAAVTKAEKEERKKRTR